MKSPGQIAADLARNGAILHLLTAPEYHLVGELDWLGPDTLFWFTAHGDRRDDGHVLRFDRVEILAPHTLNFVREDRTIAHLTAIAFAGVEDVDDYAVAFSLWKQIGPNARRLIDEAREFTLANSGCSIVVEDVFALEP